MEAWLYEPMQDQRVRCRLCGHMCIIANGHALLIGLRELRDIPPQAWQEHTRQRQQAAQALPPAWREVQRARQLVRVSSLLINIAFLLMVIPSLPHLPRHSIPAHVVLVFMPVHSIIAWRWERQGGILLLAGAALLTAAAAAPAEAAGSTESTG